ncbi:MAG: N,N-dimethylformamidase beta subunit family domain-containing protein [Ktedonobacteraceae bacterium]
MNNVIQRENAQPGTTSWQIPAAKRSATRIQAYASGTSILPGQALTFYVSTQKDGTPYSVDIYRLGWYGGTGGRLMASQTNLIGHAQGYYDSLAHHLIGCTSCLVDRQTGLVEAKWRPSYRFVVPAAWVTGAYLAKFTDVSGNQIYVPFDVRGNFHSLYVAVTSDTTYEAYNDWGGYSLYHAYDKASKLVRGVKVSYDRPYDSFLGWGSGNLLPFEVNAIQWLERQGYDVSYLSSIDLQEDPGQLLNHRAYLSLGHDEYWSKEMRDGVQQARDKGVGLAFLGANAAYWQIRFEPDGTGIRDRTIVCYKVQTVNHDLARDPFYGVDNSRVTSLWRDPVVGRPENALIGIMYSNYTQQGTGFPWQVSVQATSPILDGTGLHPGQVYGCDIVGYEWDRIFANGSTPPGLQVIAESLTQTFQDHKSDISDTTYYNAPSGAMVFASGSIYWAAALDNYRFSPDPACLKKDPVVPGIQILMAHVMSALIVHQQP